MKQEKKNASHFYQTQLEDHILEKRGFDELYQHAYKQKRIKTYLKGLKNPPGTAEELDKMACLVEAILKAFFECEEKGMSFQELSGGVQDLRFDIKALNRDINRNSLRLPQ